MILGPKTALTKRVFCARKHALFRKKNAPCLLDFWWAIISNFYFTEVRAPYGHYFLKICKFILWLDSTVHLEVIFCLFKIKSFLKNEDRSGLTLIWLLLSLYWMQFVGYYFWLEVGIRDWNTEDLITEDQFFKFWTRNSGSGPR